MNPDVAVVAGSLATGVFVVSTLPMLVRAVRTRDLSSYSGANLAFATVGNLLQSLYVITLPPGPAWVLHAFNTGVTGFMLLWWLRFSHRRSYAGACARRRVHVQIGNDSVGGGATLRAPSSAAAQHSSTHAEQHCTTFCAQPRCCAARATSAGCTGRC